MFIGVMAKGKGVSSRASLIISAKILVGNTVNSGHHAVSSGQTLKQKKEKVINKRIKAIRGLERTASMTGTARLLQRHPRIIPTLGCHCVWTSLDHATSYYMA